VLKTTAPRGIVRRWSETDLLYVEGLRSIKVA
jgi:hypothetical protein